MKIEYNTKFNVGDIVYVMDNDRPRAAKVKSITYKFNTDPFINEQVGMRYFLEIPNSCESLNGNYFDYNVFATPQELRDYVFPPHEMGTSKQ